jgi:hypothetical protein
VIYGVQRKGPLFVFACFCGLLKLLQKETSPLSIGAVDTKENIYPKHWCYTLCWQAPCGEAATRVLGHPFPYIFIVIYSRNLGKKMRRGVYMSFTEANQFDSLQLHRVQRTCLSIKIQHSGLCPKALSHFSHFVGACNLSDNRQKIMQKKTTQFSGEGRVSRYYVDQTGRIR